MQNIRIINPNEEPVYKSRNGKFEIWQVPSGKWKNHPRYGERDRLYLIKLKEPTYAITWGDQLTLIAFKLSIIVDDAEFLKKKNLILETIKLQERQRTHPVPWAELLKLIDGIVVDD